MDMSEMQKAARIAKLDLMLSVLTKHVATLRESARVAGEQGLYAERMITIIEAANLELACFELQHSLDELLPKKMDVDEDPFMNWEYSVDEDSQMAG